MKEGLIIGGLTKVHDTFQTTTILFLKVSNTNIYSIFIGKKIISYCFTWNIFPNIKHLFLYS